MGKSFVARRVAWALLEAKDPTRVEMVQFHQSYAYEDFVQGWRPEKGGGFDLHEGVFYRFCRRAAKDPENKYVFIIDEINRGNLSKVLGEVMLLIEPDKRGAGYAISLTYSRPGDEPFFVPSNVYVLGMMNTADRSLAMVDYALRRRFVFIRLEPAFDSEGFANALSEGGVPDEQLSRIVERMTALNAGIRSDTQNLGPGYEIGHSFFVPDLDADAPPDGWYEDVVRYEIAPLLREYWPRPASARGGAHCAAAGPVNVPVRNVYRMLLYAWDHLGAGEEFSLGAEEPRHLHDLFASVLADSVSRLRARGLDRGYVEVEETLAGVRGRLDLGATLKRGLLASARTHCRVDELRHDVLHNRILKSTLRSLLALELDDEVRSRVRRQVRALDAVANVRITRRDFGRVQLHRNNRVYDFALRLSRLIRDNLMVDPATGEARFRDFRADERRMGALFEAFVYRFYLREQQRFRVSRPHIAWYDSQGLEQALALLPRMRTDVVLRSPDRRIIIETKFYANPLAGRFGGKKLRSAHLYQLLTYLQNRGATHPDGVSYEGMLLYPVVDDSLVLDYRLNGYRLVVRTIDLDQPWVGIRRDLLGLLDEPPAGRAAASPALTADVK